MIHKPQRSFSASEDVYTFERRSGFLWPKLMLPLYYEEEKENGGDFLNPVGISFEPRSCSLLAGAWFAGYRSDFTLQ